MIKTWQTRLEELAATGLHNAQDAMQAEVDELRKELQVVEAERNLFQRCCDLRNAELAKVTADRDEWKDAAASANDRFKIAEAAIAKLKA